MVCRRRSMDDIDRAPVFAFAPVESLVFPGCGVSDSISWVARGAAEVSMSKIEDVLPVFNSSFASSGVGMVVVEEEEVEGSSLVVLVLGSGFCEDGGVARNRIEDGKVVGRGSEAARRGVVVVVRDGREIARKACLEAM